MKLLINLLTIDKSIKRLIATALIYSDRNQNQKTFTFKKMEPLTIGLKNYLLN